MISGDLPISNLTLDVSQEQLHINWQYHGPNNCRYDFILYVYGDTRFISLVRVNTTSYIYPDYNSCIKYNIEVTAQGSFENKGNTLNASHVGNGKRMGFYVQTCFLITSNTKPFKTSIFFSIP